MLLDPIFLLLLIIVTGDLIGKVSYKSTSLGTAAIIFVGMGFGYYGWIIPKYFETFGMMLFLYSIGLQASHGFANFMNSGVIKLILGALSFVLISFILSLVIGLSQNFSFDTIAGMLLGSLTSSPGLAMGASEIWCPG